MSLLLNRYAIGAIASALILAALGYWYHTQIKHAYEEGYAARQSEIQAAHDEKMKELETENERLRSADNVRVETVTKWRTKIQTRTEYVEKQIPVVDVSACRELSADWVSVYNQAARADCGPSEVSADCPLTETTLQEIPDNTRWPDWAKGSIADHREELRDWARMRAGARGPY